MRPQSKPGFACLLCPHVHVSARGRGHTPGKWEASAKHTGQELISHLLLQAAERASSCHRGQLSARIRQPAVIATHPQVTNQRLHVPPTSQRSQASSATGRGAFEKCDPVSPHCEARGFTLHCVHEGTEQPTHGPACASPQTCSHLVHSADTCIAHSHVPGAHPCRAANVVTRLHRCLCYRHAVTCALTLVPKAYTCLPYMCFLTCVTTDTLP